MGKVISITNQKGGVGKTTTTVNLGASLALAEQKVLIIDCDPQGNAAAALGIDKESFKDKNVYHAILGLNKMAEVIKPTEIDNLFIAPANNDLIGAEVELVSAFARETKLKNALSDLRDEFDFILIDCPPSLGLLTVNALTASDSYLVPLQCEYLALEGLSQLLHTVSLIKEHLNQGLESEGVLLTMFDPRNNLSHQIEKEVRGFLGDKVLRTMIPRNVRLSECPSFGKPIILYDVNSKGASAYLSTAREIIENMNAARIIPPPFKVIEGDKYFKRSAV